MHLAGCLQHLKIRRATLQPVDNDLLPAREAAELPALRPGGCLSVSLEARDVQHDDLHLAPPFVAARVVGTLALTHQLAREEQVLCVQRRIALQHENIARLRRVPESGEGVAQPRLRLKVDEVEHAQILGADATLLENRLDAALPRGEREHEQPLVLLLL